MSDCCWRCSAGVRGCDCARHRGVGFVAVRPTAVSRQGTHPRGGRAPSFDSLVKPVRGGQLAQRLEPARQSLMGGGPGVRGVGALKDTLGGLGSSVGLSRGAAAGLGAGAAAGAAYGSFVPILGTAVGGLVGGALGALGGALGLFGDDSAKRRAANMALYRSGWANAKYVVLDQITRTQHRLDTLDRDLIALDKTLQGIDAAVRAAGDLPSSVSAFVAKAKAGRADAGGLVDALRATEDDLNAKAALAAQGEQSGQTQLGGPAQVALDRAKDVAGTVDAQVAVVARAVSHAVSLARAATTAVNRWIDQQSAAAQYEKKKSSDAALVDETARRLTTPPPGFIFDELGNLQRVQGAYASPDDAVTVPTGRPRSGSPRYEFS